MQKTRLAAKALIEKDGKYLIMTCQLNDGSLYHDLPGGKIEFSETPEIALLREAEEELNAKLEIKKLLGYYQFFTKDGITHATCLTFLCSLKNTEIDFKTESNPDLSEKIISWEFAEKEKLTKIMNKESFTKLIEANL